MGRGVRESGSPGVGNPVGESESSWSAESLLAHGPDVGEDVRPRRLLTQGRARLGRLHLLRAVALPPSRFSPLRPGGSLAHPPAQAAPHVAALRGRVLATSASASALLPHAPVSALASVSCRLVLDFSIRFAATRSGRCLGFCQCFLVLDFLCMLV